MCDGLRAWFCGREVDGLRAAASGGRIVNVTSWRAHGYGIVNGASKPDCEAISDRRGEVVTASGAE
jgi:hypothetical protein